MPARDIRIVPTRRLAARRAMLAGLLSLGTLAPMLTASVASAAEAYPSRPVRLLVGFPPGGGGDLYGRAIANALSREMGQTIVVENKPGAGGNIAAEVVARAKPDGYTLLLAMSGNLASAPAIRKDLSYRVPDDFVLISELVETPYALIVSGTSKFRTLQEYVAQARKGGVSYASTGAGGAAQITMEMVKQQAALDILHVPYKGSGPAVTDLIGGQVDSLFAPFTPLMGQIRSGALRVLATTSTRREPAMPDVPTLKESGIDVTMTQWYGLAAPAGTPKAVTDTIARHVEAALRQPNLLRVFRADGAHEAHLNGDAFRKFVQDDIARYRRAVQRGGLGAD
ncbi:Bug family tripartite tricarboxylate transporter substrate binding protein [Cupriavidus sp. H39]|uniref:Bug family tripartite tricarboxylate transporter substrate binding protein n=1 Tax=Cupriavidus sp. H39 TaxID=3401635 RepID=UPI003D05D555